MTRDRIIGEDTPYCHWLRHNPELSSASGYDREDVDIVWFNYKSGKLMFIEVKTNGADIPDAQKDTFWIIDQALKFAFSHKGKFRRLFPGRTDKITYYGYFLVQFSHSGPLDSVIKVNHCETTLEQLTDFHKFLWFPPTGQ